MLWIFPMAYFNDHFQFWFILTIAGFISTFVIVSFTGVKNLELRDADLVLWFPTRPKWLCKKIILSKNDVSRIKCYQSGVDQTSFLRLYYSEGVIRFYSNYENQIQILDSFEKYDVRIEFIPKNGVLHNQWNEFKRKKMNS
jgi:hypothetical protein